MTNPLEALRGLIAAYKLCGFENVRDVSACNQFKDRAFKFAATEAPALLKEIEILQAQNAALAKRVDEATRIIKAVDGADCVGTEMAAFEVHHMCRQYFSRMGGWDVSGWKRTCDTLPGKCREAFEAWLKQEGLTHYLMLDSFYVWKSAWNARPQRASRETYDHADDALWLAGQSGKASAAKQPEPCADVDMPPVADKNIDEAAHYMVAMQMGSDDHKQDAYAWLRRYGKDVFTIFEWLQVRRNFLTLRPNTASAEAESDENTKDSTYYRIREFGGIAASLLNAGVSIKLVNNILMTHIGSPVEELSHYRGVYLGDRKIMKAALKRTNNPAPVSVTPEQIARCVLKAYYDDFDENFLSEKELDKILSDLTALLGGGA